MTISGAIFDLDGTLIDSMGIYDEVGGACLEWLGLNENSELKKLFFTKTTIELSHVFREKYGINKTESEIVDGINDVLFDLYANKIKKKEGILEFLELLKSKNVKMALLTASDRKVVFPCLKRNGLLEYFYEFVFCSEYNTSKHEGDIFLFTMNLLGSRKEETIVFEDALYAIRSARKIGLKTCGIEDEWCSKDKNKIVEYSDFYGKNWAEIKGIFDGFRWET